MGCAASTTRVDEDPHGGPRTNINQETGLAEPGMEPVPLTPIQEVVEPQSPTAADTREADDLIAAFESGELGAIAPAANVEEQYQCEHDCGYVGSYAEVEKHELMCALSINRDVLSNTSKAALPGQYLARETIGSAPVSGPVSPVEDELEEFMSSIVDEQQAVPTY